MQARTELTRITKGGTWKVERPVIAGDKTENYRIQTTARLRAGILNLKRVEEKSNASAHKSVAVGVFGSFRAAVTFILSLDYPYP